MTSTHDKQHKHNAKPTKHATIMRGVVAPIFGLLAVLFIVLGTLNLTVWKPAREVSATTSVSGTRYVVTDAGMLNLLGKSVNVKVNTQGNQPKTSSKSDNSNTKSAKSASQTCVALGNAKDATGWLAGQNYTRVTGLDGWKTLSVKPAEGPKLGGTQSGDEVAFKDSDMWTNVKCGDSAISMNLNDVKNDQVMIIDMGAGVTKKGSAKRSEQPSVNITMHWVRDQVPNHAMPFFIAAGVCVVLTILSASVFAIMANESFKRKRAKRREVREKAKAEEISISEAMTGSIAVLKTSLTHSRHNHRPSHKIRTSDVASAGATPTVEAGTDITSGDSTLPADGVTEGGLPGVDGTAPSVIDPTRRNLVADMQMQNDTDENPVNESDGAQGDSYQSQLQNASGAEDANADANANADEGSDDVSRFARHRGKPDQESESEAAASAPVSGRHSRHATDESGNNDNLAHHDDAGNQDNHSDADDHNQDGDFRAANVAVSLGHSQGDADSDAEQTKSHNEEGRTASSADELIDEGHAQAETTVISENDLRDYFARFSSETSSDDANEGNEGTQAASAPTSDTPNANGDGENV
ncbi:hypothetical protein [Bifidobacterium sp. ESL0732]|uniref:hypothetical protein n=1 Tax=Bifidobacterium sp. ESL0732 TaxID=2983222 RepID=UPI0023FA3963|nr:hypothetical protein [Bifidobacterium sp. ESL0732]WEV64288.1 hypothetical protein OZX70_01440 [Bifidobacterium sp. ESL0732]